MGKSEIEDNLTVSFCGFRFLHLFMPYCRSWQETDYKHAWAFCWKKKIGRESSTWNFSAFRRLQKIKRLDYPLFFFSSLKKKSSTTAIVYPIGVERSRKVLKDRRHFFGRDHWPWPVPLREMAQRTLEFFAASFPRSCKLFRGRLIHVHIFIVRSLSVHPQSFNFISSFIFVRLFCIAGEDIPNKWTS